MANKIKVMIVDDSASVRKVVSEIINSNSDMQVTAAASDPIIAENYLKKEWPDVIILDLEMPRKNGLTFLKEIMAKRPTPIIICSSLAEKNANVTMEALSSGAVDIITKPKVGIKDFLSNSEMMIVDAVRSAYSADINNIDPKPIPKVSMRPEPGQGLKLGSSPKLSADVILASQTDKEKNLKADRFIAIGASAGGTRAIEAILISLPKETPPIVIVQHMPEKFTFAYANRLNSLCEISVKEAEDRDDLKPGCALIAPGNRHMIVKRRDKNYFIEIKDGPLVCRHKPSVDVLFRSISNVAGNNVLGIILTGMGDDGAAGMKEMHNSGVITMAQDEESCLIFGMPKEAIKRGGVNHVIPLQDIPQSIIEFFR